VDTCKLHFFAWAKRHPEGADEEARPICPAHPDEPVSIEKTIEASNVVVTCTAQGQVHPVNMCSTSDFESEKDEAEKILGRYR
jgi:hypothetical protein